MTDSVGLFLGCGQQSSSVKPIKVAINAGPEGDAIKKLVTEGYPKAKIELVELPYQSLREQLITVLKGNRPAFDVVMVDDPWFPQLAVNLRELTAVPEPLVDDIVPASLKLGRDPYPNGKLRALPFVGNTQVLFYRRDCEKDKITSFCESSQYGVLRSELAWIVCSANWVRLTIVAVFAGQYRVTTNLDKSLQRRENRRNREDVFERDRPPACGGVLNGSFDNSVDHMA